MEKINVFWFRRDLRLKDNHGLHQALNSGLKVLPIFIFDDTILSQLENPKDRRVDYIHQALHHMQEQLQIENCGLEVFKGIPIAVFTALSQRYDIDTVYCNRDYEPLALNRDKAIYELLREKNIQFKGFKDQVIFEKNEIAKSDGLPYTIYTPYSKKWKGAITPAHLREFPVSLSAFLKHEQTSIPSLSDLGFETTDVNYQLPALNADLISNYAAHRNIPHLDSSTHLGIALRFGTLSIREAVDFALKFEETWLNQLIWREFFMQILYHFPRVTLESFKLKYEGIRWKNDEKDFDKWCKGQTGYPLVDAGMRQLNATGTMHNRVRMVVASFLTKHLLIDWRWGEAYFAQRLLDYDLAANNGNWQWAAGCGCDAAPYFRVFNPTEQQKKFDPDWAYIRKWIPGFCSSSYLVPMVEHREARLRALEVYKEALRDK